MVGFVACHIGTDTVRAFDDRVAGLAELAAVLRFSLSGVSCISAEAGNRLISGDDGPVTPEVSCGPNPLFTGIGGSKIPGRGVVTGTLDEPPRLGCESFAWRFPQRHSFCLSAYSDATSF